MALYNVDIEKRLVTEYWTNRYVVEAASLADAAVAMGSIVNAERPVHDSSVIIARGRVSDRIAGTDIYNTVAYELSGSASFGGNKIPLWNVAMVIFNTGSGRPSRKYIRGNFGTIAVGPNYTWDSGVAGALNTYAQALLNLGSYVDVDGQVFVSAQVNPLIAMHQLRRGSRRRTEPVLP